MATGPTRLHDMTAATNLSATDEFYCEQGTIAGSERRVPFSTLWRECNTYLGVTETSGDHTLLLDEAGYLIKVNSGVAAVVTVPTNAAAPYEVGVKIDVAQWGAGQVSVVGAVGVTVRAYSGLNKCAGQYSAMTLVKMATDEWWLVGGGA